MKELKLTIKISNEAFDLLKDISLGVGIEYRDRESSVDEFLKSSLYLNNLMTLESFKSRNHNGTYHLIPELEKYNLIDNGDMMDWHNTYYITDLGKQLLEEN
jgi:hypothetical protein